MSLGRRWVKNKSVERAEAMGARLGRLLYRLSSKHRNRCQSNLKLAFPELSDADRTALSIRVFEHFGIAATDFLRTGSRTDTEVLENMEDCGFEVLEEAKAQGKGVLLLSGHFGNWERLAHYSALRGIPFSVVARDADDAGVQRTVEEMRTKAGMEVFSRGDAARAILGALKHGKVVGLLPDQNSEECFIPLFGKPAGTVLGPAVLHLRTGAPIVCFFCPRVGPGKYRAMIFPLPEPEEGFESPREAIMAAFHKALEGVVREYPEQWLWFHDRWKSSRKRGLL
jgi:KDO2-lipid IV(A) lauroyltransferase